MMYGVRLISFLWIQQYVGTIFRARDECNFNWKSFLGYKIIITSIIIISSKGGLSLHLFKTNLLRDVHETF